MISMKRGQMNVLAIAAFALILIGIGYYMFIGGSVEKEIKIDQIKAQNTRAQLIKLQTTFENALSYATYASVSEMAAHGGYIAENIPKRHHLGIPYLYYHGKKINMPTLEVMKKMLEQEIQRRVNNEITNVKKTETQYMDAIGHPEIEVKIEETTVTATMVLPLTVKDADKVSRTSLKFKKTLTLRLHKLRELAEKYVDDYSKRRMVEKTLLNGMINDVRIPNPPGLISKHVDCESQTVYVYKKQLIIPFKENAQLAVATELKKIADLYTEPAIEWDLELDTQSISFNFKANEGANYAGKTWESDDIIYYVPFDLPLIDKRQEVKLCPSRYTVSYNVDFPYKVVIRDILETAKVLGGSDGQTIRPLEFVFYVQPYLVGENTEATDATVAEPATIDSLCQGACSIDLKITNSKKGTVWIDACKYSYSKGALKEDNVVCKLHNIVVESSDPLGFSRYAEKMNIGSKFKKEITLSNYGGVTGKITMKKRMYCYDTQEIKEQGSEILKYVDGQPPRYIEVMFAPVNSKLGEPRRTLVDSKGLYTIDNLSPSKYLVVALSSSDSGGTPSYKVHAKSFIADIKQGDNTLDIEMEPLFIEKYKNQYVHVSGRMKCGS